MLRMLSFSGIWDLRFNLDVPEVARKVVDMVRGPCDAIK